MFLRMFLVALCAFSLLISSLLPVLAQQRGRSIALIRDAEIEALINDYSRPILKAAGLRRSAIRILLVNDISFNAFVSGRNLFINAGAILASETPNEIIGVIAHEVGHLVGGHQQRLAQQIRTANIIAGVATLLGAGVAAAGAIAGNTQVSAAGGGIAAGGQYSALRGLLTYQRGEETAADTAAFKYLARSGQSANGMLITFKRFADNLAIQGGRINPYMVSHPLPRQRIINLEARSKKSKFFKKKDPASLQERHDLARAKIAAYLGNRRTSANLLAGKKLSKTARLYGRAIVTHLYGSPRKAVPLINKLIKQRPKYAYFYEMKGEILLRAGQAGKAVKPFRTAIKYDRTKAGFIQVELGHALLESGKRANLKPAVKALKRGISRDPSLAEGYGYLANALSQTGDIAGAMLATAEGMYLAGRRREAKSFAHRAQKKLKRGSPGWLRAQDIIDYKGR